MEKYFIGIKSVKSTDPKLVNKSFSSKEEALAKAKDIAKCYVKATEQYNISGKFIFQKGEDCDYAIYCSKDEATEPEFVCGYKVFNKDVAAQKDLLDIVMNEEAIKRMKELGLHINVINEFTKGRINVSEGNGFLYWANSEQEEIIKEISERYNILVYHAIKTFTEFGELLSLLYVSKDVDEWEFDEQDMKVNSIMAYVVNLNDDFCSEFGSIGFEKRNGGLVRTY